MALPLPVKISGNLAMFAPIRRQYRVSQPQLLSSLCQHQRLSRVIYGPRLKTTEETLSEEQFTGNGGDACFNISDFNFVRRQRSNAKRRRGDSRAIREC